MDPTGKVALVTGSGSGIGRACAIGLARAGCRVVVVADIDRSSGKETADLVTGEGAEGIFVPTDVSDPASLRRLFEVADQQGDGLDIVHNNAGLVSGDPQWPDTALEKMWRVVTVNVFGTLAGTKLAIECLRSRGGGVVVNTASVAGLAAMPTDPVYSASKAAIIHFTQSCGALAATDGIRVNAILPGIVDTPMVLKTGDGSRPAPWLEPILALMELLRPDDISQAVLDLIRDDSKAGQTVTVMNRPRIS
jgi:3-oxoacyl-[acyl-carrier protein] reductase